MPCGQPYTQGEDIILTNRPYYWSRQGERRCASCRDKHAYRPIAARRQEMKHGDYVLATKYRDGDPQDHWAVGFYDR